MLQRWNHRGGHYLLLLAVGAALFLVNLGGPSLWDVDEGRNATAALEMLESGNWVVPTFNAALRSHKPVLLYWLQAAAYRVFGVNEFAARLPSALAALAALLLTYELGRRLFDAPTGLLGGMVLASSLMFCAAGHFANQDMLLTTFTLLALLLFWHGYTQGGRAWWALFGVASGLAVLAKGPVGVVLPLAVIGLFLLVSGRLRLLLDRRLAWGVLTFVLVAAPWYVWVAVETRGQFLYEFLFQHNLSRGLSPMENHRGPVYYYVGVLLAGFAPWSVFLGLAAWNAWIVIRSSMLDPRSSNSCRFLLCWFAVWFVVFTAAATKLPNYILPLYPPLALLTAHFLVRWRRGEVELPNWTVHTGLACLALVGLLTAAALLVAGGVVEVAALRGRHVPGVEMWAVLGAVPMLGAAAGWWCLRRRRRGGLVVSVAVTAMLFTGPLLAWASAALDRCKAPRPLVEQAGALQRDQEIRVGCYRLEHLASLNFYVQRDVKHYLCEREVVDFLRSPLPVYLFVSAPVWQELQDKIPVPWRVVGRHRDLYRSCEVVVVTNR